MVTRGAVRSLPAGTKGADSAGSPGRDYLQGQGVRFISKYTYHVNFVTAPKTWQPNQATLYASWGFGIMYNAEWSDITPLSGYSQANIDLALGNKWIMDRDGCPGDAVSWYSVDTSVPASRWPAIVDAFKAYRDHDPRPKGAYIGYEAGCHLQDLGLVEYLWLPNATSWGTTAWVNQNVNGQLDPRRVPRAHIQQGRSNGTIDPDYLLKDTPFWFPLDQGDPPVVVQNVDKPPAPPIVITPPAPKPNPIPTSRIEDDMPIVGPILFQCNQGQEGNRPDGSTFQCPGNGTMFFADGKRMEYRWVTLETAADDCYASGQLGGANSLDTAPLVADLKAMGCLIGPVPHL